MGNPFKLLGGSIWMSISLDFSICLRIFLHLFYLGITLKLLNFRWFNSTELNTCVPFLLGILRVCLWRNLILNKPFCHCHYQF